MQLQRILTVRDLQSRLDVILDRLDNSICKYAGDQERIKEEFYLARGRIQGLHALLLVVAQDRSEREFQEAILAIKGAIEQLDSCSSTRPVR